MTDNDIPVPGNEAGIPDLPPNDGVPHLKDAAPHLGDNITEFHLGDPVLELHLDDNVMDIDGPDRNHENEHDIIKWAATDINQDRTPEVGPAQDRMINHQLIVPQLEHMIPDIPEKGRHLYLKVADLEVPRQVHILVPDLVLFPNHGQSLSRGIDLISNHDCTINMIYQHYNPIFMNFNAVFWLDDIFNITGPIAFMHNVTSMHIYLQMQVHKLLASEMWRSVELNSIWI